MVNSINDRLDQLESVNKSLTKKVNTVYVIAVLAMVFAFTTGYAASKKFGTLRVKELIIEDSKGVERINISVNEMNEATQQFYDNQGNKRIYFGIQKNGSVKQRLFNEHGDVRIVTTVDQERDGGYTGFNIFSEKISEKQRPVISLQSSRIADDSTSKLTQFVIRDEKGRLVWKTFSDNEYNASLLYALPGKGEKENVAWRAFSSDIENASAVLSNGVKKLETQASRISDQVVSTYYTNSEKRLTLSSNEKHEGIQLYRNNTILGHLLSGDQGDLLGSELSLFDKDGDYAFQAYNYHKDAHVSGIKISGENGGTLFHYGHAGEEIHNIQALTAAQKAELYTNRAALGSKFFNLIFSGMN